MHERTILRLFVALVGVYVLAWVFWERIPELARATIPYYEEMVVKGREPLQHVQGVLDSVFSSKLSEYVWQNRSMFAGGYALIGLFMLVNPIYRNDRERFTVLCRIGCIVLGGVLFLIGVAWLGTMLDEILKPRTHYSYPTHANIGAFVGNMFLNLSHALLMIALMLVLAIGFYGGLYAVLPICFLFFLFLLPGVVWDMLRFALRAPFLLWHYLHYLFVPHPMEEVIMKHEQMRMKRGVTIDHAAIGEEISRAQYDPERDGIPVWWKSENWARRLKNAMALRGRVKIEKQVADEYTDDLREK